MRVTCGSYERTHGWFGWWWRDVCAMKSNAVLRNISLPLLTTCGGLSGDPSAITITNNLQLSSVVGMELLIATDTFSLDAGSLLTVLPKFMALRVVTSPFRITAPSAIVDSAFNALV